MLALTGFSVGLFVAFHVQQKRVLQGLSVGAVLFEMTEGLGYFVLTISWLSCCYFKVSTIFQSAV